MKQEQKEIIPYVLYPRKSSDSEDRQVLSIDSQIDELKKIAKNLGLDTEALDIRPESYSAKVPGRPVWNGILKDIKAGKIKGVIAWHANRLSRNSVDTGEMIYLMDLKKLVEVVTPSQTFLNTPNDKLMLNFFCSVAKYENDNKGVDVQRGLEKKAKLGWLPTGAKPGYMNDPYAEKGNKTVKEDPVRFPIIKEAWRLMLTGQYSVPKVLEIINVDLGYISHKKKRIGGKPMLRNQLYEVFRDPFYYGRFEFPVGSGNWFDGQHKKMITEEEFWKVQSLFGDKGRPRPHTYKFAFTGMIRCGNCQAMITAENKLKRQKNGNEHRYIYYHCTRRKDPNCPEGVIEEEKLKAQVIEKLDEVEIPEEFHDFGMKWMQTENKKQSENMGNVLNKIQKDYSECKTTIDGLIDMRARKELGEDDYKRRLSEAQKNKARLESLLRDLEAQIDGWVETANDAFHFVERAKDKFKNGPLETKKAILSALGSNLTLKDRKLSIDMEECLLPMKKLAKKVKEDFNKVRTAENTSEKRKNPQFDLRVPTSASFDNQQLDSLLRR